MLVHVHDGDTNQLTSDPANPPDLRECINPDDNPEEYEHVLSELERVGRAWVGGGAAALFYLTTTTKR